MPRLTAASGGTRVHTCAAAIVIILAAGINEFTSPSVSVPRVRINKCKSRVPERCLHRAWWVNKETVIHVMNAVNKVQTHLVIVQRRVCRLFTWLEAPVSSTLLISHVYSVTCVFSLHILHLLPTDKSSQQCDTLWKTSDFVVVISHFWQQVMVCLSVSYTNVLPLPFLPRGIRLPFSPNSIYTLAVQLQSAPWIFTSALNHFVFAGNVCLLVPALRTSQ